MYINKYIYICPLSIVCPNLSFFFKIFPQVEHMQTATINTLEIQFYNTLSIEHLSLLIAHVSLHKPGRYQMCIHANLSLSSRNITYAHIRQPQKQWFYTCISGNSCVVWTFSPFPDSHPIRVPEKDCDYKSQIPAFSLQVDRISYNRT